MQGWKQEQVPTEPGPNPGCACMAQFWQSGVPRMALSEEGQTKELTITVSVSYISH